MGTWGQLGGVPWGATEAFLSNKVETPRLFSDTLHALWHVNTPLHMHTHTHTESCRECEEQGTPVHC